MAERSGLAHRVPDEVRQMTRRHELLHRWRATAKPLASQPRYFLAMAYRGGRSGSWAKYTDASSRRRDLPRTRQAARYRLVMPRSFRIASRRPTLAADHLRAAQPSRVSMRATGCNPGNGHPSFILNAHGIRR